MTDIEGLLWQLCAVCRVCQPAVVGNRIGVLQNHSQAICRNLTTHIHLGMRKGL